MTLQAFKELVEQNKVTDDLIIFKIADNDFVAKQYLHKIAKDKNITIDIIQSLDNNTSDDIFGFTSCNIELFECDELSNTDLINRKNLIIICKKLTKKAQEIYTDNIIEIGKLEPWQIKDYAYSKCLGVKESDLDVLIKYFPNIYQLDEELSKLAIFDEKERQHIYNCCFDEGNFTITNDYKVFDFTNAIITRDFETVRKIYNRRHYNDLEPLGVVTICLKNIANIISIQLAKNPTAESCGLSDKQFWAIKKYNCGIYNNKQLVIIYKMLLSIYNKLVTGELPQEHILDYLLVKMMSA